MAAASSSAASSSYSALLRRSKLASYQPSIEQVYVAHSAQKSRAQFGFKRPLPRAAIGSASNKRDAWVSVQRLDDSNRRTEWRPAVRETAYVRKIDATGIPVVEYHNPSSSSSSSASWSGEVDSSTNSIGALPLQSRFVPASFGTQGAITPIDQLAARKDTPKAPNFFALSDRAFEKLLDSLGGRTQQFMDFIKLDLVRSSGKLNDNMTPDEVQAIVESEPPVDLYAHAQSNRVHLELLLERFIAMQPEVAKRSKASLESNIHPLLGLRYSKPTRLEVQLAPTVPGRLLGPAKSPDGYQTSRNSNDIALSTVLGQLSALNLRYTSGASLTNFYPDAQGDRSNVPGRAQFKVRALVNSNVYANKMLPARLRPGHVEFDSSSSNIEPQALGSGSVKFSVEIPQETVLNRPLIGSPAYSGQVPPSASPSGGSLYTPQRLSDLPQPRTFTGSQSRSGAQHRAFEDRRNSLENERKATDPTTFRLNSRATASATSRNSALLERLSKLLRTGEAGEAGEAKASGDEGTKK
ncbi:BQ5605_C022g09523 [Microbotryum silenes-dioicae]|uniref:BQ5605_C022g09523 protein n=1 Tax=Microbotryum silenes-dioicae TaxID=796604 RepID=A0A2X0N702_9BASI|nr:BQ5605_C022g09523 [Microbotryum silenes-dioicae]